MNGLPVSRVTAVSVVWPGQNKVLFEYYIHIRLYLYSVIISLYFKTQKKKLSEDSKNEEKTQSKKRKVTKVLEGKLSILEFFCVNG